MITDDIIFYSTDCPKCRVLKKKLDGKGIAYTENHSIEEMIKLGIMSAPTLLVGDRLLNFTDAIAWANEQ